MFYILFMAKYNAFGIKNQAIYELFDVQVLKCKPYMKG